MLFESRKDSLELDSVNLPDTRPDQPLKSLKRKAFPHYYRCGKDSLLALEVSLTGSLDVNVIPVSLTRTREVRLAQ